ncbi:hypothetical protein [Streptomyces sp. LMG1-1-1.1]|uniref:hypothetical protein n=1 Tax=Streptomyces sp. LMG1-1-1.1 TaxID=3135245 RepID=UPI003465D6DC
MKHILVPLGALLLLGWTLWNLWNLFRIAGGLRDGKWRHPVWWVRVFSVSLCAGLMSWLWGLFAGGLDTRKTCLYMRHENYDEAYRKARAEEFGKLFPLHNKCNADYDLVPGWVNPTIVIFAVIALAALVVLLRFAVARLLSPSRKEHQS